MEAYVTEHHYMQHKHTELELLIYETVSQHYSETNHKENEIWPKTCASCKPRLMHYIQKNYHSQNYWIHYYDGISFKLYIIQLVHHAMKYCWNMMSSNLTSFLHSTVFHKNCRQCAFNSVCCGKSYQQSAPQDTVIYCSNEATVKVISKLCKLHNHLLYALFFYQRLT